MKVLGERVHVPDVLADGTDLRPYKRLAVAVLEAAIQDAKGKPNSLQTIDARRFLSGNSPLLEHWCRLIDVRPDQVRELVNGRERSERRSGPKQTLRVVHSQKRPRVRRSERSTQQSSKRRRRA
ncbi:MAG: hypothetical protein ACE5MM_09705 [Nitrospiraceae bacterium]